MPGVKEIVVISGKGGTGKTSIVAAFASLAGNVVMADCDVDAANLHLLLSPKIRQQSEFYSGWRALIDPQKCTGCGQCHDLCRFDAIIQNDNGCSTVDPLSCEGCGVCAHFCPEGAIAMEQPMVGELYVSETRFGPMVHARLGISAENSGKLVAQVRQTASIIAGEKAAELILIDGPPGIGCPAISSVTGADLALIVTEPTLSGLSDLERAVQLVRGFQIPVTVCINKYDINMAMSERIAAYCDDNGLKLLGRVHYDNAFSRAQLSGATILEYAANGVARETETIWEALRRELDSCNTRQTAADNPFANNR